MRSNIQHFWAIEPSLTNTLFVNKSVTVTANSTAIRSIPNSPTGSNLAKQTELRSRSNDRSNV
ncbi:hypothetical protein [Chamaesiphon sp.]|uniref:hypothetical protein n=1 Tax=Chamaesiphon sp. TaxID=2814140 RepID=UPI0035933F98